MLNTLKNRKKQEGFTLIEVLIVLAIAGLILLVVFLAVPALQRNQRNTARRSEAGRLAAAAQDQLTNSNGNPPLLATDGDNIVSAAGLTSTSNLTKLVGALGTGATAPAGLALYCKATDYKPGNLTICSASTAVTAYTVPATDGAMLVEQGVCGTTGNSVTVGTNRQLALFYTVETGGGRNSACINVQ